MTTEQLTTATITFNTWITLENKFSIIQLVNDGRIFITPSKTQLYFDSTNELIFVRYLDTRSYSETPKIGFVRNLLSNGKSGYYALIEGGFEDSTLGKYHDVFSFDAITTLI